MTLQQFKLRICESLGIKTRDRKGRFVKLNPPTPEEE